MAASEALDQHSAPETGLTARTRAGLFFLALVLRLAILAQLAGSPWSAVLLGDARYFDEWGRRIAAGAWASDGAFYQAPLYPYCLGALYALLGHVPGLVRGLQCLASALAVVWIADGTSRFASRRAGVAAGVLATFYAPWIGYDLQIEKTAPACALTALLFHLAVARGDGRGWRWPLVAGLVLGALVLLRENAVVLLVPLAWAFGREPSRRRTRVAALGAGLLLALLPVALHNAARGGAPLPTASNAGVNFYIGNGAEADGMYRPLLAGRGHPDHEREDATRIARDLSGRELGPAGVSAFWFRLALEEIADEPGHFVRLLGHKLRLLAHHGEIMDAVAFEVFQDESWLLRGLGPVGFGLLLPLFLAGAVVARGRRLARPILAGVGLLALSILAFFVVGRFRLGLVPLALPFAGIALVEALHAPRRGLAAALFLAGLALAWWPLPMEGDPRATSALNLASELVRQGDAAAAEPWARRARELDPASAEAAFNLGIALRLLGKPAEAAEPFECAMALQPAFAADCLAELGAIRSLEGDPVGARQLLERALALDPGHESARRYLEALAGSGRSE